MTTQLENLLSQIRRNDPATRDLTRLPTFGGEEICSCCLRGAVW